MRGRALWCHDGLFPDPARRRTGPGNAYLSNFREHLAPKEGHGVGDSESRPSGLVDSSFPRQKLEGPALTVTQLFIVTLGQVCPQNTPGDGYGSEKPQ